MTARSGHVYERTRLSAILIVPIHKHAARRSAPRIQAIIGTISDDQPSSRAATFSLLFDGAEKPCGSTGLRQSSLHTQVGRLAVDSQGSGMFGLSIQDLFTSRGSWPCCLGSKDESLAEPRSV